MVAGGTPVGNGSYLTLPPRTHDDGTRYCPCVARPPATLAVGGRLGGRAGRGIGVWARRRCMACERAERGTPKGPPLHQRARRARRLSSLQRSRRAIGRALPGLWRRLWRRLAVVRRELDGPLPPRRHLRGRRECRRGSCTTGPHAHPPRPPSRRRAPAASAPTVTQFEPAGPYRYTNQAAKGVYSGPPTHEYESSAHVL